MANTHEYEPRRKDGKCKTIVGGRHTGYRHCGEAEDAPVHSLPPVQVYRVLGECQLDDEGGDGESCGLIAYVRAHTEQEAIRLAQQAMYWDAEQV